MTEGIMNTCPICKLDDDQIVITISGSFTDLETRLYDFICAIIGKGKEV